MGFNRRFTALNGVAILVGVVAGLAAVGLHAAIRLVEKIAFEGSAEGPLLGKGAFQDTGWGAWVILVPMAGGLIVGAIRYALPETRRQGIAEVMAAVQAKGGILRGRTAWGNAAISAITVGTGGSTGREGPIGYIGAALGSSFGRRLGFQARDIKVLLGAGTAAGIAATFNAPLGGVLFAMELILPEFSTHAFIPVVIATVVGVTVSQVFLGDQPAFIIPTFDFVSAWELGFYLALGIACGLGGVGFIRSLSAAQEAGQRLPLPYWTKPAIGGLIVGAMGYLVLVLTGLPFFGGNGQFHIFGTGYATVDSVLQGDSFILLVPILLLLIVFKPLASAVTIGSGGGGGVFSSSLFQGGLYGALIGMAANTIAPEVTAPISAYALVGMGAFYAATGRATLTTIVLMTELTDGYEVVLPIMFAAVTADAVSVGLSKDSIYTVRLEKAGIHFQHDRQQSALDTTLVQDIMTTKVDALDHDATVADAFDTMLSVGHNGYPVVEDDQVIGVLTQRDITRAMNDGKGNERVEDVVSGLLITCFPTDYLHTARDRIFDEDIGRLIVVDPEDRRRLLGILTRSDIIRLEAEKDVGHEDMWSDTKKRGR